MAMSRSATQTVSPRFLPFLPADNGSLSPASEEAVSLINTELAALLRQDAASFWRVLRTDKSLLTCIDSYLRYKRRDHDDGLGAAAGGESASSVHLARRMFMVLMRMVSSTEGQAAGLTPQQHAALLYDQWLLDVPKLMDVCVLYGPTNTALLKQFMQQVFALQPRYTQDLETLAPLLVQNLGEVLQSCRLVSGRVMKGELALANGLADACSYLRDVCVTLLSLTECYSPAATALVRPSRGSLLETLARLHDDIIPIMTQAVRHAGSRGGGESGSSSSSATAQGRGVGGGSASVGARLQQLGSLCQRVLFRLLQAAYLQRPSAAEVGASGALSSGAGVKSHATSKASQEQLGSELMTLLMMLAHQTGGGSARSSSAESHLLQHINERYTLDAAILAAVKQGTISVDDTQFEYLLALLGTNLAAVQSHGKTSTHVPHTTSPHAPSGSNPTHGGGSSSSAATASGPSTSSSSKESAQRALLVASVKEILPDYGDGFVAACLHAMGMKAEAVVQALLEGALPDSVAGLDSTLAVWPPAAATAVAAKGKGTAGAARGTRGRAAQDDDEDTSNSSLSSLTWAGLSTAATSRAAATAAAAAAGMSPYGPSVSHAGGSGFVAPGRKAMHKGMSRALGQMGAAEKQATSRLAEEFQLEYDDEYDDSFDDLQATGADGVCDVEGDGVGSSNSFAGSKDAVRRSGAAPLAPLLPTAAASSPAQPSQPPSSTSRAQTSNNRSGSSAPGPSPAQQGTIPSRQQQQQQQPSQHQGQQQRSDSPQQQQQPQRQQQQQRSDGPQFPQSRQQPQPQSRLAGPNAGTDSAAMGYGSSSSSTGAGGASGSGSGGQMQPNASREATRPGSGQQGQGGGGRGRGGARQPGKQWVLGDRIYNYAKEGAQEVGSRAEAEQVMDAAVQAAQAIYGLGPGGNKGVPVTGGSRRKGAAKEDEEAGEDGEAEEGGEGGGGGGAWTGGGQGQHRVWAREGPAGVRVQGG
ncbi:MAG: hypothetical protein WDW36_003812 [Sanguina aurantia]